MSEERPQALFGTDGVRGKANVFPMTVEVALKLGQAIAHVFRRDGDGLHRFLIGKDTRLSGYMFEDALAAGICSMGGNVIQVGPMPTPAMAFLTRDMRCDAGAMISASHNPYHDNGIKFFAHDGFKLPDSVEQRIEALVASDEMLGHRATPDAIGRAKRIEDAEGRYVVFLKKCFPFDRDLEGLRVVLDCANGAAYKVGPTMLQELGAELFTIGVEPNGTNINEKAGSLYPERLSAKVRELRADIGIAVDGDADRVMLVDEKGAVVDGDALLALFAKDFSQRGKLRGGAIVATAYSNLGLEKAVEKLGLRLVRTKVGDRYVVEGMREGGYNIGGEQSGHIIFLDHNTTGDGLLTGLQALAVMCKQQKPLSELVADFERFPQALVNVKVSEKTPIEELPSVLERLAQVENELGSSGRVLIRYSGTEPKARVMVEGEDEEQVAGYAQDLADALSRAVGGGS
ncbi:MAG: phosphoglucosamine mutase [Deltaproteobacteria bacterium]|nr:phosphoglucosamine mutase [Deltaproteobacteria bacterium]MBW2394727.1 phosphoglucosamine mutase [Deltaproteobacteria bacterium]